MSSDVLLSEALILTPFPAKNLIPFPSPPPSIPPMRGEE